MAPFLLCLPGSGAHHEGDVFLRGELERQAGVARVAGGDLGGLPVPLEAVVVALPLGEDVAALRIAENVPRLATPGHIPQRHKTSRDKRRLKNVQKASQKCTKGDSKK